MGLSSGTPSDTDSWEICGSRSFGMKKSYGHGKGNAVSVRTADHIYELLVDRIAKGVMAPGGILAEQALAAEFDVSRTPVREALHRLEQAMLVERGARRAFVVRRLDGDDLADLFEAVGEVESALAALAALRMSEIELRQLSDLVAQGNACGDDAKAYTDCNVRFHTLICQGARSSVLASTLRDLNVRTQAWRSVNFREDASRMAQSRNEHEALAAAILARDGERTRGLMRAHVAASYVVLVDVLSRRPLSEKGSLERVPGTAS